MLGKPYGSKSANGDDNDLEQMGAPLRKEIELIDPTATQDHTFWNELSWDIAVGDWMDEEAHKEC